MLTCAGSVVDRPSPVFTIRPLPCYAAPLRLPHLHAGKGARAIVTEAAPLAGLTPPNTMAVELAAREEFIVAGRQLPAGGFASTGSKRLSSMTNSGLWRRCASAFNSGQWRALGDAASSCSIAASLALVAKACSGNGSPQITPFFTLAGCQVMVKYPPPIVCATPAARLGPRRTKLCADRSGLQKAQAGTAAKKEM